MKKKNLKSLHLTKKTIVHFEKIIGAKHMPHEPFAPTFTCPMGTCAGCI